jgi:hypothetical protein
MSGVVKTKRNDGVYLIGLRLATPADHEVTDDGDGVSTTLSIETTFPLLEGSVEMGTTSPSASPHEGGAQ